LIESKKIRYIYQKNAGVAAARNVGFTHSIGQYIAFLDDDDIWPPDKLEWQVKEMENGVAVAIGGSTGLVGLGGQLIPPNEVSGKPRLLEFDEFFDGNPFVSPGQVLISSAVVMRIGGFDPKIWGADDYDFFMRLWKEGPILRSPTISLYYRIHQSNASNNHIKMIINTKKVLSKHLPDLSGLKKWQCRSRGYLWLFDYLGETLILGVLDNLNCRPMRFVQAFNSIRVFFNVFGGQMLIDLRLSRRVFGYLLRLFPNFVGGKLMQENRN
jgi:glycosyltransferase involved in cell wall biosynthesis